jgi:hypothetical protein
MLHFGQTLAMIPSFFLLLLLLLFPSKTNKNSIEMSVAWHHLQKKKHQGLNSFYRNTVNLNNILLILSFNILNNGFGCRDKVVFLRIKMLFIN